MKKENILWGLLTICLLLAFLSPLLPSLDKDGNIALKVKTILFNEHPLERYRISISECKTEKEKLLINTYNKWLDLVLDITKKNKESLKISSDDISNIRKNYPIYLINIEQGFSENIRKSLSRTVQKNVRTILDDFYVESSNIQYPTNEKEKSINLSYLHKSENIDAKKEQTAAIKTIHVKRFDHEIYEDQEGGGSYLKMNGQYIPLQTGGWGDVIYEEKTNGQYVVFGLDNNKEYLISWKPQAAIEHEKDERYFAKCDSIEEDYKIHPENYIDVGGGENGDYTTENGGNYHFEGEGNGFSYLEEEGVYALLGVQRFVKRK